MKLKITLGVLAVLAVFLGYVSTKDGHFRYQRNGLINATPGQIFPYLTNFKVSNQWVPYAQKDPNMKTNFKGTDNQVGSIMEFDGNSEAGTGNLEITNIVQNSLVEIKLTMTKPFNIQHSIQYTLTPEGNATRFAWIMFGDGGFMGKLMSTFMNCENMIGKDLDKGVQNLKALVESKK